MGRRSPRRLRPGEAALWDQVARSTRPLHDAAAEEPPADGACPPSPAPPAASGTASSAPAEPLRPFELGAKASHPPSRYDLAEPVETAFAAAAPAHGDRKLHQRLRRGKLVPEARIDLHGMTLEQAHPALIGFIQSAQARGQRLVLIITGKGRPDEDAGPIPRRQGILRNQVPMWLRMAPLAPLVLQVQTAHQRHGGIGAYYIHLRRSR